MREEVRNCPQNLYFSTSVSVKIEDGIVDFFVFLFNEESTNLFTLIVEDLEVDTFEMVTLLEILLGKDRIYVVRVLTGLDDPLPGPLKLFPE